MSDLNKEQTVWFPNMAGRNNCDEELARELEAAGIEVIMLPEPLRNRANTEVFTVIFGSLHRWSFERFWKYWVCKGPGIEIAAAEKLHRKYGSVVRVDGDCTGPDPRERFEGLAVNLYHVDTQQGLNALAETIRGLVKVKTDDSGKEKTSDI